ncbi:unnamed protein product [Mytilus edulis]|uniref:Uncharacterized protein n=1 Tax=Mytilus edulis TaxID=6550 RepID=A0A8S3UT41_MYTED|nr:unnamed protein product [Mytilus edulis]
MKLLPNRRLVRFADVGTMDYHPRCMCIRNDIVIIYIWCVTVNEKNVHTSKSHIIWMNTDGILTKRLSFSERIWKLPSFIQSLESGVCVLYCENCTLYFIDLLDAKSDKCDKLYRFKGIYGLNPEKNFDCTGMCTDQSGNLLVSDHRHHSVYVLDKELKYIKTLFDARNGLDKPAAINIFNDQIWVSDGNQMYIFLYTNV